jgi:hypothetical protein
MDQPETIAETGPPIYPVSEIFFNGGGVLSSTARRITTAMPLG